MSSKKLLAVVLVVTAVALSLSAGPSLSAARLGSESAAGRPEAASRNPAQNSLSITIPYSGRLADQTGQPVADGAYDFAFALYESEEGEKALWSEVQEGIQALNGGFGATLGAIEPIPAPVLDATKTLWLAVGVRGPGETEFTTLSPRQRLSATPATSTAMSQGAACPHDHFGESWSDWYGPAPAGLTITNLGGLGLDAHAGLSSYAVKGFSGGATAIYGETGGDWSYTSGVYGKSVADHANGVTGWNTAAGVGLYGYSEAGWAGYFGGSGMVYVAGYLMKAGGGFKIDHPLDPANQYLYHSFVESPDQKNIYDGVAVLDAEGAAWVELPDWFEAVNKEFRYQLTPVGAPAPGLYVAQEIADNRFRIAGGVPGLKVSWQVTGIRHDPYAAAHPMPVEQAKPSGEQGTYLHPIEHGQPLTQGLDYRQNRSPGQSGARGER
jgi:hypothetical protein